MAGVALTQCRQPEESLVRRTRVIVLAVIAVAAIGGVIAWRQWPVAVQTAAVTRGPAIDAVYATGSVEPTVMVPVAPRTGGRLVALAVDEGAHVKRGQMLARLEAPDLDNTVQEMLAREQLARSNYERTQDLVAKHFVSAAELDRTRTELEAAQAASRRAQAQRDYNLIAAPADGMVLRRDGEVGQFIAAGQAVFTLACCAPLRVSAEVDEEDIPRVRVGQAVVMRSDAFANRLFEGKVAAITPKGDPTARSYRVRVQFDDAQGAEQVGLRPGMTMDVNIVVARRENVLLIPSRAVQGDQVWVVEQGRVHARKPSLGAAAGGRTEVRDGLDEHATVVVAPPDGLRDGRRANPSPAPQAAAGSAAPTAAAPNSTAPSAAAKP